VVLDEAQNIKNANTHAAEVVTSLNARHRLCLSGTPMENNLGEIWSLFHFLMPGFLGSQKRFTELFRKPIEKLGDPEALQQLRARVTPFMLRRTKALVASELPPKVETVMRVELSGKQADLYETIRLGMEKTVREALNTNVKEVLVVINALIPFVRESDLATQWMSGIKDQVQAKELLSFIRSNQYVVPRVKRAIRHNLSLLDLPESSST